MENLKTQMREFRNAQVNRPTKLSSEHVPQIGLNWNYVFFSWQVTNRNATYVRPTP